MDSYYRVGISHDFATDAQGRYEAAIESVFSRYPKVQVELMPEAPDDLPPREVLDRYDAILALGTKLTAANLEGLKRLAIVGRWGVGYDRIDTEALTRAGVVLAITPNAVRRPVAEAALGLVFACTLNLVRQHTVVDKGGWRKDLPRLGWNLAGRTLGSIGLGNIAREMFRMSASLGFGRRIAYDPYGEPMEGVERLSLEEVFREADYLCVHCLLNEETRGLVNRERLRLMKPTAYLINTARGPIVKEADLVEALREGWIAGAGLDVFEVEPLPVGAAIREAPNVILAPHALAWTEEIARDNSLEAAENIAAVARGELPGGIVNRAVLESPVFQAKLASFRR